MVKAIRFLIGLLCAVMALSVLLAVVALLLFALVLFMVGFLVVYVVAPEESKAFWGKVRDQIEDWVTRLERLGKDAQTLVAQVLQVFPGMDAIKKGVHKAHPQTSAHNQAEKAAGEPEAEAEAEVVDITDAPEVTPSNTDQEEPQQGSSSQATSSNPSDKV